MKKEITRRNFVKSTAMAGAGAAALYSFSIARSAQSPGDKLIVGVMGLGRGMGHIEALLTIPSAEVAYVCDVDEQRMNRAATAVSDKQGRATKGIQDFRRMLEDKNLDAVFIATPNHWHTPAAMLACSAGKHVYVEKPGSHNAHEAEMIVAAAKKYKRVVQMGNQRRSWPAMIEAIEKLRSGVIGKVLYARTWYNAARTSIGKGKRVPVPAYLNYDIWQGPAPERPYLDNLVPYNWHWHWHWGGGELANNGIHALDVARWGLGVEYPERVTFNGGRYHFDDDQETPDTGTAVFHFGSKGISWDDSSCNPRKGENPPFIAFYGEQGSMTIPNGSYHVYDFKGKEIDKGSGPGGDKVHIQNFLDCVRSGTRPNSHIEECQKSTLLCHLGNIAYRTGHTLRIDSSNGKIIDDKEAQKLWGREYRKGWEPKV